MKLKLLHKVFLANFLVIGLLSIVLLSVSYFSFKTMSAYIDDSAYREDQYMVNDLAANLGQVYARHNSWQPLQRDQRHWRRIVERNVASDDFPPQRQAGRPRGPRDKPRAAPPPIFDTEQPLPHFRRPHIVSRIELLDSNKKTLIPAKNSGEILHYFSINHNQKVIGWLGLVKASPAEDHGDSLMRHQLERVVFMAFIGMILSSIVSFYLARHFVAPIRNLIHGAIELSERKFDTKIEINSNDELAELAHYFNDIGIQLSKFQIQQKQWLQDIAHELRTPLTIIRGEIEAMVDGVTEPTTHNLVLLQHDVLRLNHLVNDLHELSVTDDLTLNRDYGIIEFDQLCINAANRFSSKLGSRGISLITDFKPCSASGDESRLLQVLDNLLHNCHKYTEQGGSVWFSSVTLDDKSILIVEDSGPGVRPRKLEKLFDRLYRVDAHRGRDTGGAGLGLAICKNIILAHNGTIIASISEHGGLKITITLPTELSE